MKNIIDILWKLMMLIGVKKQHPSDPQSTPKPTDILADAVAAKILANAENITPIDCPNFHGGSEFFDLSFKSDHINVKSHMHFYNGDYSSALSFTLTVKDKIIKLGPDAERIVSKALYKGYQLNRERKRAKDDAENEFNALDAIVDIFNIAVYREGQ